MDRMEVIITNHLVHGNERRHKVSCTVIKMRLGEPKYWGSSPRLHHGPQAGSLWSTRQVCVPGPSDAFS